jgi:uncharacterized protein YciI
MKFIIAFLTVIIGITACNNANDSSSISKTDTSITKNDTVQYGKMKGYWMVFLYKGPNRMHDSASAEKIQKAHIANIERLAKEGTLIMAGPMGDETNLRGIFILDCKDSIEAVNHVQSDTAIKTGRLRFEIHPWWTATGTYVFK